MWAFKEPVVRDQPGLRKRIVRDVRRIEAQHRQLQSFHAKLAEAIEAGSPAEARSALLLFSDALAAHFTLENSRYFPALHGLLPELESELTTLVREHEIFRGQIEQLRRLLEGSHLNESGFRLAQLADGLASHEKREEQLLESLEPLAARSKQQS